MLKMLAVVILVQYGGGWGVYGPYGRPPPGAYGYPPSYPPLRPFPRGPFNPGGRYPPSPYFDRCMQFGDCGPHGPPRPPSDW